MLPLINAIFPPLCVHCRREGDWLCSAARLQLAAEIPLQNSLSISNVDQVWVRGSYDQPVLAQLIQKLKYHYWHACAETLFDVLEPLKRQRFPLSSIIVPVPLHSRRLRERGFNQSLLISRALGVIIGRPVVNLLRRTRYTPPQAKLSAAERETNIVGAIGQGTVAKWPNSVILVDDVITTGSTIAECASVLRQHGVQHITAVALAKG